MFLYIISHDKKIAKPIESNITFYQCMNPIVDIDPSYLKQSLKEHNHRTSDFAQHLTRQAISAHNPE